MIVLDPAPARPVWRYYALNLMIVIGLACLITAMAFRQIIQTKDWVDKMAQGSTRVIMLPAPRGAILDRNGEVLVDNRPSYNVALFLDEFKAGHKTGRLLERVKASIKTLRERMKMNVKVSDRAVLRHHNIRGPLPLTVWNDLSPAALAAFEERSPWMPGVDLDITPVRVYPYSTLACHVIGYVGKPEIEEEENDIDYDSAGRNAFSQPNLVGKNGIEATMETELQGTPGRRVIRLNAAGLKEAEIINLPPTAGNNVVLSIDREIQAIVEESYTGYRGACVILDPRNGDVVAMASMPTFNPNLFVPAIRASDWRALISNEEKPLLNRAIQAIYSPGSSFKVISALAGLEYGMIKPTDHVECSGYFSLGNNTWACWEKGGHGDMRLKDALTMSCNVYFYTVGLKLGQKLIDMAAAFGFGQPTGIPLEHESPGILPSDEWKRRRGRGPWTPGDGVNVAIGQGSLHVTPLQMAMVASAMANGGTLFKPRLILRTETHEGEILADFPPSTFGQAPVSPEHMQFVRDAMLNVVANGTGKRAALEKIKVAAKTGSAQFSVKDRATGDLVKQTRAWMIAFAPYEAPRYALAIVAEAGESGGVTTGPVVGAILKKIFALEHDRTQPRRPPAVAAIPVNEKIEGVAGDISGELLDETAKPPQPKPPSVTEEIDESPPSALPAEKVRLP
ncbi:MAG: penicillin-binding protein 2 [Verrucomicrobiae bacterium]|nr:penicillin-binding protein 2 [Verrucomicrobiae bacterium]